MPLPSSTPAGVSVKARSPLARQPIPSLHVLVSRIRHITCTCVSDVLMGSSFDVGYILILPACVVTVVTYNVPVVYQVMNRSAAYTLLFLHISLFFFASCFLVPLFSRLSLGLSPTCLWNFKGWCRCSFGYLCFVGWGGLSVWVCLSWLSAQYYSANVRKRSGKSSSPSSSSSSARAGLSLSLG